MAQISGSEGGPEGASGASGLAPPGRAEFGVPLETKLHPPSLRKEWVERRDLIGHLSASAAKLILVDAPAGFGKTTLVAQWRASAMQEQRFAWVSLDRGDNDPARLWGHVVEALQRASPELGDERLGQWLGPPQDLARTLLPLLVNELAAVARGGGCSVTIGGSIALIIIGAILKWGITWKPKNIDLEAIGVILMIGGVASLLVAIYFVVRRNRRTAGTQVYEERRYTEPPPPPPPPMGP